MRIAVLIRFAVGLVFLTGNVASASVVVSIETPDSQRVFSLGDEIVLELRASADQPLLGWGLDLVFDPTLFALTGNPVPGPIWTGVAASDGDGLAALAFPAGLSGSDLLLTTVILRAIGSGTGLISAASTPGDLAEGFPLDPSGFEADVQFESVNLTVIPEPGTGMLLLIGLAGLGAKRRQRHSEWTTTPFASSAPPGFAWACSRARHSLVVRRSTLALIVGVFAILVAPISPAQTLEDFDAIFPPDLFNRSPIAISTPTQTFTSPNACLIRNTGAICSADQWNIMMAVPTMVWDGGPQACIVYIWNTTVHIPNPGRAMPAVTAEEVAAYQADPINNPFASHQLLLQGGGTINRVDPTDPFTAGILNQEAAEQMAAGVAFYQAIQRWAFWLKHDSGCTDAEPIVAPTSLFTAEAVRSGRIRFDASTSLPGSSDITVYIWNFGDGSPLVETTEPFVEHDYAETRRYNAGLRVNNRNGATDFSTLLVDVETAIVVNSPNDRANESTGSICDTGLLVVVDGEEVPQCTFRAAIEASNERGGATIDFEGSGDYSIQLQSPLPDVTAPIQINPQGGEETLFGRLLPLDPEFAVLKLIDHEGSEIRGIHLVAQRNGAGIRVRGGGGHVFGGGTLALSFENAFEGIRIQDSNDNDVLGAQPPEAADGMEFSGTVVMFDDVQIGVSIGGASMRNRVLGLRLSSSETFGIDLEVPAESVLDTPNDALDLDVGPNGLVNWPIATVPGPNYDVLDEGGRTLFALSGLVDTDMRTNGCAWNDFVHLAPFDCYVEVYVGGDQGVEFKTRVPLIGDSWWTPITLAEASRPLFASFTTPDGTSELKELCTSNADGDAICDDWENAGGIDVDFDGDVDFALPSSFSSSSMDIAVEIDFFAGERQTESAYTEAIGEFADHGVNLVIDFDEDTPFEGNVSFGTPSAASPGVAFDEVRWGTPPGSAPAPCAGYFGTAAERASTECSQILLAKRLFTRYHVDAEDLIDEGRELAGIANLHGSAFASGNSETELFLDYAWIAFLFADQLGSIDTLITRILALDVIHELGHTLGLRHRGDSDEPNCSPFYPSVMSYASDPQYVGLTADGSRRVLGYRDLFFSTGAGGDTVADEVNERFLFEESGFGRNPDAPDALFGFFEEVDGLPRIGPGFGPLDIDASGVIESGLDGRRELDINNVGACDPTPLGETHRDSDDWELMRGTLAGMDLSITNPRFGSTATAPVSGASRAAKLRATYGSDDPDADGIDNLDDNCILTPNPGQQDTDGDGMGDACEDGIVDADGDRVPDSIDNCVSVDNPRQTDSDGNGVGDACTFFRRADLDRDGDVDDEDRDLFNQAFGSSEGAEAFDENADYDGDGVITFADYQVWLQSFRDFENGVAEGDLPGDPDPVPEPHGTGAWLAAFLGLRAMKRRSRSRQETR